MAQSTETYTLSFSSSDSAFLGTDVEGDAGSLYRYCASHVEASQICEDLQSLDGSSLEQDDTYIYVIVSDLGAALKEAEEAGYLTEEV